MHHLPCNHWSNKTDTILGSSGQKTTQKQLKMIVSASRKAFENLKRENTYPILTKIAKYVYHLNTCHSAIPEKNQTRGGG